MPATMATCTSGRYLYLETLPTWAGAYQLMSYRTRLPHHGLPRPIQQESMMWGKGRLSPAVHHQSSHTTKSSTLQCRLCQGQLQSQKRRQNLVTIHCHSLVRQLHSTNAAAYKGLHALPFTPSSWCQYRLSKQYIVPGCCLAMGLPASLAGAVGLAAYQGTKVALQRGPTQPESIKQNTHYKRPTTAEKLKITRKATCSGPRDKLRRTPHYKHSRHKEAGGPRNMRGAARHPSSAACRRMPDEPEGTAGAQACGCAARASAHAGAQKEVWYSMLSPSMTSSMPSSSLSSAPAPPFALSRAFDIRASCSVKQ